MAMLELIIAALHVINAVLRLASVNTYKSWLMSMLILMPLDLFEKEHLLGNEEKGIVELPASMSKQSIYSGWCYSQGYKAKANAKGSFGSVTDYELRSYDDILWPEGSQSENIFPLKDLQCM